MIHPSSLIPHPSSFILENETLLTAPPKYARSAAFFSSQVYWSAARSDGQTSWARKKDLPLCLCRRRPLLRSIPLDSSGKCRFFSSCSWPSSPCGRRGRGGTVRLFF